MGKLKENYQNNKIVWWWLIFFGIAVIVIQFTPPMIPLTGIFLTGAFFLGRWSVFHEDAKKQRK